MWSTQALRWGLIGLTVTSAILWLALTGSNQTTDTVVVDTVEQADIHITDFTLSRYDQNGDLVMTMTADQLENYAQKAETFITRPDIELIQQGTTNWHIRSAHAVIDENDDLKFESNVEATMTDVEVPVVVTTNSLWVINDASLMRTDDSILIVQGNHQATAIGMLSDLTEPQPIIDLLSDVNFYYETLQ